MANDNRTAEAAGTTDYAGYGVECLEDIRHNLFIGTADALIAAGLIEQHQVPGQPGSGKTMAGFLPDGARGKQGSGSAKTIPGYKRIYKTGRKFIIEVRPDDDVVATREACQLAACKKENKVKDEARAWRAMRDGIARCCFGSLRLVWQTEI